MMEFCAAYGTALFELAKEAHVEHDILIQAQDMVKIFTENPAYIKLLDSPMLGTEERTAMVDRTFSEILNEYLLNFIKILTEKQAVFQFEACISVYIAEYDRANQIERAVAVTAAPLDQNIMEQLTQKASLLTGKTVILTNKVVPSCLGGVILQFKNQQIDGSIKTKLEAMKKQIASIIA